MPRGRGPGAIRLPPEIAKAARAFESLDLSWAVTAGWMRVQSGAGFSNVATFPGFELSESDGVVVARPNAILSASHEEEAACAVNGTLIPFPRSQALLGLIRRLNRGKPHLVSKLLDEFAGDWDDLTVERDALLDFLVRIGRAHGLKKV